MPVKNPWTEALKVAPKEKYKLKSPLTPNKEGYLIGLYKGTPPNKGITIDDLETEPIRIVQNTPQGPQIRLIPAKNPYLMKGATEYLQGVNAKLEAENERIASSMESQWRGFIKEPSVPYKPLLKKSARDATDDEIADSVYGL